MTTPFKNSRYAPIPVRLMLARERRLDSDVYLSDGFRYRHQIGALPHVETVKDIARVWQPSRLKGVRVRPQAGLPFLTATQAFDVQPVPRKWLSKAHIPKLQSRYVNTGTILVTCSGNIGDAIVAYSAHEGFVISHDLLRVESTSALTAYLYTYFRTRQGRAVMRSSQYGNIIKHLEPEHLETVPVPLFEDTLTEEVTADISEVFRLRTEAHGLSSKAESLYSDAIGSLSIDESAFAGFTVTSSDLFVGRRRLEAYAHNPIARAARTLVNGGSERVMNVFGVPTIQTCLHVRPDRDSICGQ